MDWTELDGLDVWQEMAPLIFDSASDKELVTFESQHSHSWSICDSQTPSDSYNFQPANKSLFICPRWASQDAKMHYEEQEQRKKDRHNNCPASRGLILFQKFTTTPR